MVDPATHELVRDDRYAGEPGISISETEFETRVAHGSVTALRAALDRLQNADPAEVRAQVALLVKGMNLDRARAATELETFITAISRQTGVDRAHMIDSLRVVAGWLEHPSPESLAKLEALAKSLGWDPVREEAREDQEREARIEADVKKSMDDIFGKIEIKL